MNRYGTTVVFWTSSASEDDHRTSVGNFVDGFPDAVANESDQHEPDVLMQDTELTESDVEVEA